MGDRYVLEAMIEGGFALGGEQSGHVIARHHATTGDGVLTSMLLARLVHESGRDLADLTAPIERLPQTLINVSGVDKARLHDDQALADEVAAAEKTLGETGRVVMRPSGTEQLVRVMVEAASEDEADRIAQHLADVVRDRLAL